MNKNELMPQDELDTRYLEEKKPAIVEVLLIAYDDEKFAVVKQVDTGIFKKVPKQLVQNSYNVQKLPFHEFEKAKSPYDWEKEFENFSITRTTFLELMYQYGYLEKKEFSYNDFLNIVRIRGKLPLRR